MNVYLANAEVRPELEKIPTIPESSNGYMVPRKQKCWYGQGHSGPRVKLVHCELNVSKCILCIIQIMILEKVSHIHEKCVPHHGISQN